MSKQQAVLPSTTFLDSHPHLKKQVYEPAEDTYLFLDGLLAQKEFLQSMKPSLCVEIGPGSGCITTYLAGLLKSHCSTLFFGIDINWLACQTSLETWNENNTGQTHENLQAKTESQNEKNAHCQLFEMINDDLTESVQSKLKGKVDVLLWNPPYVPTEEDEHLQSLSLSKNSNLNSFLEVTQNNVPFIDSSQSQNKNTCTGIEQTLNYQEENKKESSSEEVTEKHFEFVGVSKPICASYSGGKKGREVIDRFVPMVEDLLSPNGCLYLILVKENAPQEVIAYFKKIGFAWTLVARKVAHNEQLYLLKFQKIATVDQLLNK